LDREKLINFLNAGKSLYIDGTAVGYRNDTTMFYKMLGARYLGRYNSITSLIGEKNTIVDGKLYNYLNSGTLSYYIDEITADKGKLLFHCDKNTGKAVCYNDTVLKYRVIYSSFNFSSLRGYTEKNNLMEIYMKYLTESSTYIVKPVNSNQNSIITNCFIKNSTLHLTLHKPGNISITMYTISGKRIKNILENKILNGTNHIPIQSKNSLSNGMYIVRINTNQGIVNKLIFEKN